MFCIKCGNKIEEGMNYCSKCGSAISDLIKKDQIPQLNQDSSIADNLQPTVSKKFKKYVMIGLILTALIIAVVLLSIKNEPRGIIQDGDGETVNKVNSIIDESSDSLFGDSKDELGISAKKEDGSIISDFKRVNDKLFVSADYQDYDFQCPYEVVLEQKDFNSFDRIYLIEHQVDENRITEDSDGNRIKQIDGVTHYVMDTIRVMCEYTTADNLLTVKKYYIVCMSNWAQEEYDQWNNIVSEYIGQDEELNYCNLNDTYWCVDGNDIASVGSNYLDNQGVYDYTSDKFESYLCFHDLEKVSIDEVDDNGVFSVPYSEEYEMCSVKVLYDGCCVEEELVAGDAQAAFIRAFFWDDMGLSLEIGVHRKKDPNSYSSGVSETVIYADGNSGKYNKKLIQITKEEYENASGLSSKESMSANAQGNDSNNQVYKEYVIEGSDSGYFDETYLYGFTADECRLARNEIYARHGKIFNDVALQEYFNKCSWYTPEYEDVPDSMLNQWELENVKTIVNYEKTMGYR